jgi:alpha-L-fucosidase
MHVRLLLAAATCAGALSAAEPVNLASFGVATASSEETARGNRARHAIDGDPLTRWCSNGPHPQSWLAVDLGGTCRVTEVRVQWEKAEESYACRVETSLDGRTWKPLHAAPKVIMTGRGVVPGPVLLRHVRVTHLDPRTSVWSSVCELEIIGLPE